MTDKTEPQDSTTPEMGEAPEFSSMAQAIFRDMVGAAGSEMRGDGLASLLSSTTQFVDRCSKPDIGFVEDPVTGEEMTLLIKPDGTMSREVQDWLDDRAPNPRERQGTAQLTNLDSFIAHVNRFGDGDSAVFAKSDPMSPTVTAVLDYNRADGTFIAIEDGMTEMDVDEAVEIGESERTHGEYRYGRHRSHFAFPLSDEWQAWKEMDGEGMTMTEFAAFLENNVLDVAEIEKVPESASRFVEMMGGEQNIADWSLLTALAKSLTIFEKAHVSETTNLANGQIQLILNENQEAEVDGVKATVPTMFFIQIPLFKEGVKYRIPVRLRTRKGRGSVTFFYQMWNPERAFTHAFDEAIDRIGEETSAQIFYGSPE